MPNRLLVDQGSNMGPAFIQIASDHGVPVDHTGVEHHNGLSIKERYHHPLRITYRRIKNDLPNTDNDIALACAVKALNDTIGPDGIVPSLLVFGELPRLEQNQSTRPTTIQRSRVAQIARDEMSRVMANMRLKRALKHKAPSSANVCFEVGEPVLVWREKGHNSRIGEYRGPYTVTKTDKQRKNVYIADLPGKPARPFNVAQIKRYHQPSATSEQLMEEINNGIQRF